MKKLLILAISLFVISCKTKEWNKETIKNMCLEGCKNEMYNEETIKRANEICDCVADKTFAKYPTEQEANENYLDVVNISNDCRDDFDKAKATKDSLFYEQNPDLRYMKQP